MWHVEIVEGYGADLAQTLTRLAADRYAIRFVLPNGVNRWTVVDEKEA